MWWITLGVVAATLVGFAGQRASLGLVGIGARRARRDPEVELAPAIEAPAIEAPATPTGLPSTTRAARVARSIQERALPDRVLRVPGVDVTGASRAAAECGGDWWSCHALPDGRVLVVVGDVGGHDHAAALVAMLTRGFVEGTARSLGDSVSASRVLTMLTTCFADLVGDQIFMTCCVLVIDPRVGAVHVASAGHPFPYVRRLGGALEVVAARGAPLGTADPAIGTARVLLGPGDVLLVHSDGLVDRIGRDGARFGERRLRKLLADSERGDDGLPGLLTRMEDAIGAFADGADADDDLTIVLCERRGAFDGTAFAPDPDLFDEVLEPPAAP